MAQKQGFCAEQVENAIDRATKEKRVAELTEALEQSTVVFGLRYKKISVRPFAGPSKVLSCTERTCGPGGIHRFVQLRSTFTCHRAQLNRSQRLPAA